MLQYHNLVFGRVPLYHLWFLVDLTLFICSAAIILPWMKRFKLVGQKLEAAPLALMLPVLALFSISTSLVIRSTGIAYESIFGLTSLFRLVTQLPFFAIGIYMHGYSGARKTFLLLRV